MGKIKQAKVFFSLFLSLVLIIGASLHAPDVLVSAEGTEVVVNTLAELRAELESKVEKTVVINNDIAINSGYMIEMPTGANITLKANGAYKLTASGSNFRYGAIQVKKGAQLTIDDNITFSSAIGYFLDVLGSVTMNNGSFIGNKGGDGGAIYINSTGSFIMNGGEMSNNAGANGGAVYIKTGGSFTLNNGKLSNNTATSAGGAVYANGQFTMNGGEMSNNTAADQGGAIYIETKGTITINAGDFINNTANARYGGAIGTGTAPQSSQNRVFNAVIVGNNANKGDGRGGGIWSCPSGIVSIDEKSTFISGNNALKRGNEVAIESTKKPTMPTTMLGGADYEWYWDMENQRYPSVETEFENNVTPPNYDSNGIVLTNAIEVTATDIANLKAQFPLGKVFMYNNTAVCGGAVGGNGTISFVADETLIPPPVVPVQYPYTVEYYKDSVAEGNLIAATPGMTEFDEGYSLTNTEVSADLGSNWIDAKRPEDYTTGSVSYVTITTDPEKNVVIVVYVTEPTTTPKTQKINLGWMRSTEVESESFKKTIVDGDAWTYSETFNNTPIKYFENTEVQDKANEKAADGTENVRSLGEQLVGIRHIWDLGDYCPIYKELNGDVSYDWASWQHWGISGNVEDKGEYSIRRFAAYFEMTAEELADTSSVLIAPEDELGNMSYLFPINDNVFVFVNGTLAYWGGSDVSAGNNQYGALNRTEFMGKEGIKVRDGVNGIFKNIYPHTDGWCIDIAENKDAVNIKSLLQPGFNRIDIIADEYWEGGGMNRLSLFADR